MSFIMRFSYSANVSPSTQNIQKLEKVYGESACFWRDEDGCLAGVVPCLDQNEFINMHNNELRDTVLSVLSDATANKAIINQFPTPDFMGLYKDFSPFFNLTCATSG